MRTPDKTLKLNRRRVLQGWGGTAVLAATIGSAGNAKALAASLRTIRSADAAATLLKVARDIYPHDRLPDTLYENAIITIDKALSEVSGNGTLLEDGVRALDAAATAKFGKAYASLAAEADRVLLLKAIEGSQFFQTVRSKMVTALYNQPEVWTLLGYEGSSAEHGGYLKRGFDDIDWLPA